MELLSKILADIKSGEIDTEIAVEQIKKLMFTDLGYAMIDDYRETRVGYPEIIYGGGKSPQQILGIIDHMSQKGNNILCTKISEEAYQFIKQSYNDAQYNPLGKVLMIQKKEVDKTNSYIGIVCAGTSDLPVVEEAFETAKFFGNDVKKIVDVGVAGIHRLFDKIDLLRNAKVLIVVAGMEGALPSVVAGLVDKPVIAVPTSVGYGASFGGISALLAMLNSCAGGISVVNIDNGFGAAYQASMINKI